MSDLIQQRDRLLEVLRSYGSCAVAFSAGVDSTVVAKAAAAALGDRAVAVTAEGPSLAQGELEQARTLARQIGIRHIVIQTREQENPNYLRNDSDRCYHCKTELYVEMERRIDEWGVAIIANGANADDVGDYRPGMRAAADNRVRSPLIECGIGKAGVRVLAAHWGIPIWDKPAMPCLASRVAYGEEVTPERMAMVDGAERFLRERGFPVVRCRYHRGDVARLEVPPESLAELCGEPLREELCNHLKRLGFKFVTLDLEGFRSGSLNSLLPVEMLIGTPRQ